MQGTQRSGCLGRRGWTVAHVTAAPSPQLAELQCEVAALRQDQKALCGLVESLRTHVRALSKQQELLRSQLQNLDSLIGER